MSPPWPQTRFFEFVLHYARAGLRALKISDLFDETFSVETPATGPKSDAYGFLRLMRKARLDPRRSIMVEDLLENLKDRQAPENDNPLDNRFR
jgi:FMN phosphatase YigB (HAD superfamily)